LGWGKKIEDVEERKLREFFSPEGGDARGNEGKRRRKK